MFLFEKKMLPPSKVPIEAHRIEIPLERLRLGVDNLRYDVHISPEFIKQADEIISQLILKHADASGPLLTRERIHWHQEISKFKTSCRELMASAVNQAKSRQEIQIDYLAQMAIAKLLIDTTEERFDGAVQHFKSVVRRQEVSRRTESHMALREEVGLIIQRRSTILEQVSNEILSWFAEVRRELDELRSSIFGEDGFLPGELFGNPLLRTKSRVDDYFMMDNYVLLGHRIEDPLNYHAVLSIFKTFFGQIRFESTLPERTDPAIREYQVYPGMNPPVVNTVDRLLRRVENMDMLFNYPETRELIRAEKQGDKDRKKIRALRGQARTQKDMFRRLHRTVAKEKLLDGIVAAYRISPTVNLYCPPLTPQEVLQFAVIPKSRKQIIRKITRFNRFSEKPISLFDLRRASAAWKRVSAKQKRDYLIRFLKDFAAYHRDLENYTIFRETADCVNIAREDKIIRLSRENNTLYEFMLPRERAAQKPPIIRHVVLKADVRGSTGIIDQMKEKGLNPASNFSLNFFDPITHLISVYGAEKVFIEGDAIILSISEYEGNPETWYSVARACGLAVNILMVVKRYNVQNRKNRLPRLNLGIGISFSPSAPTFFYDGNTPIMISPAINQADILSECDRVLRERFSKPRPPFGVYVYQINSPETTALLNSPIFRYNVMGVELSPAGFEKLADEIHMQRFEVLIPEIQAEPFVGYTGKFPTTAGNYQRVVIREADIPEVTPDFSVIRQTGRKYYEVCTHPKIYDHVKRIK